MNRRKMNHTDKHKTGWKQKVLDEAIRYWAYFLYMGMFFAVFANYRRLVLAYYDITYRHYGVAVIKALVLAKVVLVAESLRLGRGFDNKPLVVTTLFQAFLFTLCVGIFDAVESLFESALHGLNPAGAIHELVNRYNLEWLSGALVIFCAFMPFFAARELGRVFGKDVMLKLFFRGPLAAGLPCNAQQTLSRHDDPVGG